LGLLIETPLKKDLLPARAVTFAGATGAFCKWQDGWITLLRGVLFATIATGLVYGILRAAGWLAKKFSSKPIPDATPKTEEPDTDQPVQLGFGVHVPFGPMLAIGALLYFLLADQWIAAYFAQFSEILTQQPPH
jgi:leader peptidase (prepilin peptidase)/N-methyltransferase